MKNFYSSRRTFLKTSGAGAALGSLGMLGCETADQETHQLSVAGYDYDRVRAIMDGHAGVEGADVRFDVSNIYAMNRYVFGPESRYDVSEIGLIPFVSKYINEDFREYTLIPVFVSRTFRHRNIFVRTDAGIESPGDLRGKRVGTPGYGMSANTWIRGFLLDQYGVQAHDMQWIETTASSDEGDVSDSGMSGGKDSPYFLPDDFPIVKGPPGVDESELMMNGDCDALITAIPPKAYLDGDPRVRLLFPDPRAAEIEYFRETGLFPIMHAVAVRRAAIDENPDLPRAVFKMYSKAKQMAYDNLEITGVLKTTLPWGPQELEATRELMGNNFWPYGIGANRKELELVMRYTHEQGLVKRLGKFEDLFHPSTMELAEPDA